MDNVHKKYCNTSIIIKKLQNEKQYAGCVLKFKAEWQIKSNTVHAEGRDTKYYSEVPSN
jgi:hypothetical protein